MRVPSGKTAGSAATIPFVTGMPDAVTLPVQYAVAVNSIGVVAAGRAGACTAGGGGSVGGPCGGGTSGGAVWGGVAG